MGELRIELGWPAKELSPNARKHFMTVSRFKKAARTEANWATRAVIGCNRDWEPEGEKVKVHLIASPPDKRARDSDNLIASIKGHLDGIADALGVNDRIFEAPTISWAEKSERGSLIVVLS